jgi:hypothetical protein
VHEAELISDLIERLGMAEEKIARRLKAGEKVLDNLPLGRYVEID